MMTVAMVHGPQLQWTILNVLVATGPMRRILQKTDFKVHYAAPAGDVMMAGPVGLIKAIMSRYTY